MKSKLSLTIGIPVYNEEANIANLLDSILSQKQENYTLEKIIVVSDGSTDNTEQIVKQHAKKHPIINLIADGKREGKKKRLIQLYRTNTSSIILISDGDILPGDTYVIEKMINYFKEEKVTIVSANIQPVKAENFQEKILYTLDRLWYEVRKNFNNGDNIYNIRSCFIAIRQQFAKGIIYKLDLVSEAQYLYFLLMKEKLKFRFAKEAVVLFRLPSSFKESYIQKSRFTGTRKKFANFFGNWIYSEYQIPLVYKIRAMVKMLLVDLVFTLSAIFLHIMSRHSVARMESTGKNGVWKIAASTKKSIFL